LVYTELNEIIEELGKVNQENSSLIEQALKIVNFTMDVISTTEEAIYSEKDTKKVKPFSRIFDKKA